MTYAKISPKSGEPQRYSWGTQKKTQKKPTKKKKTTTTKKELIFFSWQISFKKVSSMKVCLVGCETLWMLS